jgi:Uma2 family endonuclease
MTLQERLYTIDEFLEIASLPENELKRLELDEGVIVEMPPSRQKNTIIAMRLGRILGNFVEPNDLGYVSGPDGGYRLTPNTLRQPDVAFISKARHPVLEGVEFPIAPDIAIEVISPNEEIVRKVSQYIAAGTRLVLALDVDHEVIYTWHVGKDGGIRMDEYRSGDTIDFGNALPGFSLALKDVFPQ